MSKKITLGIFIILQFHQLCAQYNFDSLNRRFDTYESNLDFNGVILIAKEGKLIFSRSIGYADFKNEIELDLTTPMHLASNSKAFTNMGIMILAERGALNYKEKVTKYLEDFPYPDISIEHLMTMTSGFKRLYNQDLNNDGFITNDELLDFISRKKPGLSFQPGEKVQSSVVGHCILAEIISVITQKDFEIFMKHEIFQPLGMENTFVVTEDNLQRFRAISYNSKNKIEEWYLGSYIGGVSIYASAEDLLKWDQSLYTDKLVSFTTLKKAFERFRLNNGEYSHVSFGGWMRWKDQEDLIFKNGDWVANNSILWRDISNKLTVIILNNRQNRITKFDLMDEILPLIGYDFGKS